MQRVVLLTGLWLLAVVMLPTRVHERYLLLCIPFLVLLATRIRWLIPGLVGLVIVVTAQVLVYHWQPGLGADEWVAQVQGRDDRHVPP